MNGTFKLLTPRRPFPVKLSRIIKVLFTQPSLVRRVTNIRRGTAILRIKRRLLYRPPLKVIVKIKTETTITGRRGKGFVVFNITIFRRRPDLISITDRRHQILPARPFLRFNRLNQGEQVRSEDREIHHYLG